MLNRTQAWIASSMPSSLTPAARSGAPFHIHRGRAPIVQHRLDQLVILERQRRDRAVSPRSEDALVEARRERGEQLALAHAPLRGPAHHRLRPRAHRAAPQLRPVQDRLHDVGHSAPAHQANEYQLQLFAKPVAVLHATEAHQSGSSPRSAAMPRSSRCSAAPTVAATVSSNSVSSEWLACSDSTSASVILYAWRATLSTNDASSGGRASRAAAPGRLPRSRTSRRNADGAAPGVSSTPCLRRCTNSS